MGDFDAPCTERRRHFHEPGDMADIGTVDHCVDGERKAETDDGSCEVELARVCAGIAVDVVRAFRIDIL